jgi:8-oxo-dGTP pyrophosphatase MutT (NUDIX family)
MEPFAAGIVPVTIIENKYYFLLGLERSNNKWSGFVGGSESGETPKETAIREFHEETKLVFEDIPILLGDPSFIDLTSTGKKVYLWFIEMGYNENINSHFKSKRLTGSHFNEKSELKYFSLKEIVRSKDIFYKIKNVILRTF